MLHTAYIKRRAIAIGIVALIFVFIPIVMVTSSALSRRGNEDISETEELVIWEEVHPSMRLGDASRLRHIVGRDLFENLVMAITNKVLDESEIAAIPYANIDLRLHGTRDTRVIIDSFELVSDQPIESYTFNIKVADGRTYKVRFLTHGLHIRAHCRASNN